MPLSSEGGKVFSAPWNRPSGPGSRANMVILKAFLDGNLVLPYHIFYIISIYQSFLNRICSNYGEMQGYALCGHSEPIWVHGVLHATGK
jgi:hypothetical protein